MSIFSLEQCRSQQEFFQTLPVQWFQPQQVSEQWHQVPFLSFVTTAIAFSKASVS